MKPAVASAMTSVIAPRGCPRRRSTSLGGKLGRASERMPIFRTEFATALEQAAAGVTDGRQLPSVEWLEIGEALRDLARRVGFAAYCAEEWAEPADDAPDIDDPPMVARGRRNVHLWDATEAGDV